MTLLDRLIPHPRLHQIDHIDVTAPVDEVWERLRHGDLGRSAVSDALFALRTIPARLTGHDPGRRGGLRIDDLVSTSASPGFQVLGEEPGREVVVGAIGKVWKLDIPFLHVDGASDFAEVRQPGWVKVAWALRVSPRGDRDSRVELELRVEATDDISWRRFRRYFRLIGPFSHFLRRALLRSLGRDLGDSARDENLRPLAGDDLLPDATAQLTHSIEIRARPEAIWPWLVQMGCRRGGFYSLDVLDNGRARSAREIHPDLQQLAVGQILPARPTGEGGFEVLRVAPSQVLALGGLFDPAGGRQLPFHAARPPRYWHATWTFVLEALDSYTTRLRVRVRVAFSRRERVHAAWIGLAHRIMQPVQLRNLAARAEGRQHSSDWRDVLEGLGGASRMALAVFNPLGRPRRAAWGIADEELARIYPGDELVPRPKWTWSHAVEIDAPAAEVWRWVAQVGADRGGFYSYQWLENLAGCRLRNAEAIHPEWEVVEGDALSLHPKLPPMRVAAVQPGRAFVARAVPAPDARKGRWADATWLFLVEPLGAERCRFISRYRVDYSSDLATRLQFGPALVEPIGTVMDRRMLLGVKQRAEEHAMQGVKP